MQKLHAPDPPRKRSWREWRDLAALVSIGALVIGWLALAGLSIARPVLPLPPAVDAVIQYSFVILSVILVALIAVTAGWTYRHVLMTPPEPLGLRLVSGLYLFVALGQIVALTARHYAAQNSFAQSVATAFSSQFGPLDELRPLQPIAGIIAAVMIWQRKGAAVILIMFYTIMMLLLPAVRAFSGQPIPPGILAVCILYVLAIGYLCLPATQRRLRPADGLKDGWICRQCSMKNINARNRCKRCYTPYAAPEALAASTAPRHADPSASLHSGSE